MEAGGDEALQAAVAEAVMSQHSSLPVASTFLESGSETTLPKCSTFDAGSCGNGLVGNAASVEGSTEQCVS